MSTGHGGADPYGDGRGAFAQDPYAHDPYAQGASAHDPFAPAPDPYAGDPYATAAPSAEDPLTADGFGPRFGDHAVAPAPVPGAAYGTGYGPAGGYVPPPASGAAITAFVLGLLALTFCSGLTAPVGLIFAAKGMKETSPAVPQPAGGRGLAIAGLVTSIIGLIPLLLILFWVVVIALGGVLDATSS